MKERIIISVSSDLATDQRVQKVAKSCFDNGYDVLLVGRKLNNSLPFSASYRHKRFNLCFNQSFLFYVELNIRLFFYLLFSKSDILLANDTDTLPANFLVSKIRRKKLIFDAHELFPEVPELVNRPKVKKVWEKIENVFFPKLKNAYTVSGSIADYYKDRYGVHMEVVRNVPYKRMDLPIKIKKKRKTILYQGALNKGRCLEYVIPAMQWIENAELIIAGDGDVRAELEKFMQDLKLSDRVTFLGKLLPDDFKKLTPTADVGLCLLENMGLSYYFSLPNRIFDYLHAGVPVLASDFPEIKKIVEKYKTGLLTDNISPESIAEKLNEMLSNPMNTAHFAEVAKEYCWENEEKKLIEIIQNSE